MIVYLHKTPKPPSHVREVAKPTATITNNFLLRLWNFLIFFLFGHFFSITFTCTGKVNLAVNFGLFLFTSFRRHWTHVQNGRWRSLTSASIPTNTVVSQSVPASYKPSPLGYGSSPTRSSPFRRPESPASPSPLRHTTPTGSPTKAGPFGSSTLRFTRPTSPTTTQSWTPKAPAKVEEMAHTLPQRPTATRTATSKSLGHGSALSQLQPSQVRTLRDGFQILDRDCDGVVNREDVADMLNQLGM